MEHLDVIGRLTNWFWLPLSAITGWLLKRLHTIEAKAERADDKADQFKIYAIEQFVTRKEHIHMSNRIDTKLDRILDKLEQKADK
jgi:hypothetical protein